MKTLIAALCLFVSCSASALIIGGNVDGVATFIELTTPFSESNPDNTVGQNNFNTGNFYGFNEDQNIILPGPLDVDILADGTAGQLAANTIVASHYVFFDPRNAQRKTGWVEFDAPVLAILTETNTLDASDFLLNNNVTYLSPNLRGIEENDFVSVNSTFDFRVDLDWFAGNPGDYIRVLTARSPGGGDPRDPDTAAVPAPTTLLLFPLGLLGLMLSRRKSQA